MTILEAFGDLRTLNDEIMSRRESFVPDPGLFSLFDDEYLGYMNSEDEAYYRWLALAVRILQPGHVLELGSFTGGSAVSIFQELARLARLTMVDIEKDLRFCPAEMLEDPRVAFVCGNDLDLSIFGDGIPAGIDLLFIDTVHNYRQISAEWEIYQHLLSDEALVAVDDIRLNDMGKFWDTLRYEKFDATRDCHSSGFGIFIFERGIEMDEQERLNRALQASKNALASV